MSGHQLPGWHRHVLGVVADMPGCRMNTLDPWAFASGHATLDDLVDEGLLRYRRFGYEVTLAGWRALRVP